MHAISKQCFAVCIYNLIAREAHRTVDSKAFRFHDKNMLNTTLAMTKDCWSQTLTSEKAYDATPESIAYIMRLPTASQGLFEEILPVQYSSYWKEHINAMYIYT